MTLMGEMLRQAKPQGADSAKRAESANGKLSGRDRVIPPEITHRESSDAQVLARAKAQAPEVYARRQKLGEECVAYATAVKVDAMTLMGEMLKATQKNKGARGSTVTGNKQEPVRDTTPTLRDHGISKRDSSDAQVLARAKAQAPEVP